MSLSIQKRWEIIFLSKHKHGPQWSCDKISKYLKIDKKTVNRWLKRYSETGDVQDLPKSGAKRKTSEKEDKLLLEVFNKYPQASASEMATYLQKKNINLSVSTIKRRLAELGFKAKAPKPIPLLTERHILNRRVWAEQHTNFNWEKVIFTDECTFIMENRQKKFWVKDNENYVIKKVKHPLKVHAWGCFSKSGFGKFIFLTKNLDANFMCKIYQSGLMPSAKNMFGNNCEDWVLQEDNDPKHRSQICTHFKTEHHIKTLQWPSMSPDVNPIENVWGIMKTKIAGKPKTSLAAFKKQLRRTWHDLPNSLAEKLACSMENRVKTLLERNGDYIGY